MTPLFSKFLMHEFQMSDQGKKESSLNMPKNEVFNVCNSLKI